MSRYWRRRLTRHGVLAFVTIVIVSLVAVALREGILVFRLSMGTAYASLLLLAFTLVLGPWNVLTGKPNPVSSDLRRDTGLWAAAAGIVHIVFGLQVHLPGHMLEYFFTVSPSGRVGGVRLDLAGATNWAGVAAGLILLLLVGLSNDVSLRRLGTLQWKVLQRWTYALFGLVVLHGAVYQYLERRALAWVVAGTVVSLAVVAGQLAGRRRHLEAHARGPTAASAVDSTLGRRPPFPAE